MFRLRTLLFALLLLLWSVVAEAKILLTGTSDLIQVITASAVTTIYVHASWADNTTTDFTPGRTNTQIATAATTTVVGSPAASTQRQVKLLMIRNSHASSSNAITVQHTDGTTVAELIKYTLLAGETLQYTDDDGFRVIDASGQIKSLIAATTLPLPTGASTSTLQGGGLPAALGAGGGLKVDGSGTALPVSGTVTVTDGAGALNVIVDSSALPSGAATSANQDGIIKDGAGDTTQANVSSGRLHVDGSGVTQPVSGIFWQATQPISAASLPLPTGAATEAKQPALGTAGTPSADVITVQGATSMTAVKVDGSATTQPVSGTVTIGTFPDNEPFNVAQINGVTPLMGAGNTGTGSQRVTIASDQAPVTVRAANSNAIVACTSNAKLNMTTATTTEIVALSGSTTIYICSFSILTGGATNVKFVRGTGTNCATGQADVSSNMHFLTTMPGIARGGGLGAILFGAASGAMCVTSSAAVNVDVDISYAQF